MKAQLLSRSIHQNNSFTLSCHSYKSFLKIWHYHPELELVVIMESTGTRFVGDSIEKFEPGELILLGKNLPHLWLNDKAYFDANSDLHAKAHVIHFHENFNDCLTLIPEFAFIHDLFQEAKCGIKFEGSGNEAIIQKVNQMFNLNGYDKILKLLEILKALYEHTQRRILSSAGYVNSFKNINNSKIVKIYEFIMNNFKHEISLENAADLANMNPCAFSRYFKNTQKKTFTQFLNEVRIGYACKLLMEKQYNIAEVCFESGFNNISNFNRQFKSLKQMSPSQFIKMHTHIN